MNPWPSPRRGVANAIRKTKKIICLFRKVPTWETEKAIISGKFFNSVREGRSPLRHKKKSVLYNASL